MILLNQDEQNNIEEIILALTAKYNIECIYLNTYDHNTTPYELTILVSNKYLKTLGELVPKIVNTIREFEQYRVMCYIAFQAKDRIREGNLFLFTSCQPNKRIYPKEGSGFMPIPLDFDAVKLLKLAIELSAREHQKIGEFRDGYYHFKERNKYPMAAFLLHQTIELTYRYIELLLTAKERITHSIRCHHRWTKELSSLYTTIFDEEKEEDTYLLQLLGNIYRATRYEDNFQVGFETLLQLERKMEDLLANATEIFNQTVLSFEQQHIFKVDAAV
ncbi:HEPN domain-containing protein [Sphingobacterium sp. SRCM116780]|uniref:HEPN domain-containing protein n=1 Tax=Sphingobacterium sp. SRCM116780 TaxID=2907623 RepID=UPI001F43F4FA|nr:HEPN domain-containing protein [Sphingobacterium sp. SRCM116780]UIR57107.1 HEPN domain-containing protein [Sphingobacterium sp. SRCM116780]